MNNILYTGETVENHDGSVLQVGYGTFQSAVNIRFEITVPPSTNSPSFYLELVRQFNEVACQKLMTVAMRLASTVESLDDMTDRSNGNYISSEYLANGYTDMVKNELQAIFTQFIRHTRHQRRPALFSLNDIHRNIAPVNQVYQSASPQNQTNLFVAPRTTNQPVVQEMQDDVIIRQEGQGEPGEYEDQYDLYESQVLASINEDHVN
jgi:hypothetical protein